MLQPASRAETLWGHEYSTGFKAGLSINDVITDRDTLEGADHLIRPVLGMYGTLKPFENVSVRGGLQYGLRGSRLDAGQRRNLFHYIDFPFSLRYKLFGAMHLHAGVKPSLLLFAHHYDYQESSSTYDYSTIPNVHSGDLNITAGIDLPIFEKVELGFQYGRGLISINQDEHDEMLHSTYEITLNFNIGREDIAQLLVSERDTMATYHINRMKEGVILFRLPTRERSIEYLEDQDRYEEAEELRADVKADNNEIMRAVQQYFDFTTVFFFYSQHSSDLKVRNFENLFSPDEEENDISYIIGEKPFYIMEFGSVERGDGGSPLSGLVIKDQYFNLLERPFPYFVRETTRLLDDRTVTEMIIEMNKELHEFYIERRY